MNIHFTRLHNGFPGEMSPPCDFPHSWLLFHVCKTNTVCSAILFDDMAAIRAIDVKQWKNAQRALYMFNQHASNGLPFSNAYDEKECHESGFEILDANGRCVEKIWRIRKGNIRIYWCYMGILKNIVILRAFIKNQASNRDKAALIEGLCPHLLPFFNNKFVFMEHIV